jgi:hypothetical protein
MSDIFDVIRAKLLYGATDGDDGVPARPVPLFQTRVKIAPAGPAAPMREEVHYLPQRLNHKALFDQLLALGPGERLFYQGISSPTPGNVEELTRWDNLFSRKYASNGKPMCSSCCAGVSAIEDLTPSVCGTTWECASCAAGEYDDDYADDDDYEPDDDDYCCDDDNDYEPDDDYCCDDDDEPEEY